MDRNIWDGTTAVMNLDEFKSAIDEIEKLKTTIVCSPDIYESVRDYIDGLFYAGLYEVVSSENVPSGTAYIFKNSKIKLAFPPKMWDNVGLKPFSQFNAYITAQEPALKIVDITT